MSLFDDMVQVSMKHGLASVRESTYDLYFVGNPTENKPFEIVTNKFTVKSSGGWILVRGGKNVTITVFTGGAEVYNPEGEFMAKLEEGYKYDASMSTINTDVKWEVEIEFKTDGTLSSTSGISNHVAEEAYVKPYIDKKREEWESKQGNK